MVVGLQGSGKTTTIGKLARLLREQHHNPLLVPADVYRPRPLPSSPPWKAARHRGVSLDEQQKPRVICRDALAAARMKGFTVVLIDTAGRCTSMKS